MILPIHPPMASNLALLPSCVLYLGPYGSPSGGTTFMDRSPYRNTISRAGSLISNSASYSRYPPGSIRFQSTSNSSYLSSPATPRWNLSGGYAVLIDVVFSGFRGGLNILVAHTETSGYSSNGWIATVDSSTGVRFETQSGGIWSRYSWSVSLSTYTKYRFVFVKSGTLINLWINGVARGTKSATASVPDPGTALQIGNSTATNLNNHWFTGYISEMGIWNGNYGAIPTSINAFWPATRRLIG